MELRQLEYYLAIIGEGGFSRAARKLHVGQPALSKQMQALEHELGVQLLTRTARGVTPTEAGRRLAEMASQLLLYAESIRSTVQDVSSDLSGVVSVGVSPSLVPALAEHLSSALAVQYPRLQVKVVEALPMFLLEWLETDRLDMGIFTRWPDREFGSTLDVSGLGSEEVLLAAARSAVPLTDGTTSSQKVLLGTLRLALTPGFRLLVQERVDLDEVPQELGPEIDSVHTIMDMVLRGEACSVLPFTYLREDLAAGRIVALSFRPPLRRELVAVARGGRSAAARVDAVVGAARSRIAELMVAGAAGVESSAENPL